MSQENLEIIRKIAEAFNAGGLDAVRQYYDPEIEWHEEPSFPEAGVYRGIDEVLAYTGQFIAEFEDLRYETEELTAAGDHVVANLRITGTGKTSGAGFEQSAWWAFTFRDGRVVQVFAYLDKDAALKAVGLTE